MKFNLFEEFQLDSIFCNVAVGMLGAAAVGTAARAYAANQAAGAQTDAANRASAYQTTAAMNGVNAAGNLLQQSRSDLQPYRDIGSVAGDRLRDQLPFLTTAPQMSPEMLALRERGAIPQEMLDLQKPITLDQATLESLPGYQFTKTQGLKAVQNSAAARGLGVSGAALKGAATFATGLADSTYTNQFNLEQGNRQAAYGRYANTVAEQEALRQGAFGRYQTAYGNELTTQGNAFNRLQALIAGGQGAATAGVTANTQTGAITGNILTNNASQVGGNIIGAGNATAAADNAIGNAVATGANSIGGYAAYRGLYGDNNSAGGK